MDLYEQLLGVLLPKGGWVMELAEFYLDGSVSGSFQTVGGFLFSKENRIAMEPEWQTVLKKHQIPYFHMTDCALGFGDFKGKDVAERSDIQIQLFKILRQYKSAGYVVSFDIRHKNLLPNTKLRVLEQVTPYSLCCYWALHFAGNWVKQNGDDKEIAYFFESGDDNQAQAAQILGSIENDPWHKKHFRLGTVSFVPKTHSGAIQSADALAWQWSKNLKERSLGNMKPRADLLALIDDEKTFTMHFDRARILEVLELIRGSGNP